MGNRHHKPVIQHLMLGEPQVSPTRQTYFLTCMMISHADASREQQRGLRLDRHVYNLGDPLNVSFDQDFSGETSAPQSLSLSLSPLAVCSWPV